MKLLEDRRICGTNKEARDAPNIKNVKGHDGLSGSSWYRLFGYWLMHFDDVAIRVLQEDLVPIRHGPNPVIRIRNVQLFEAFLEAFNIVRPKAEVTAVQRIDGLLHAEAQVDVLGRQVELDCAISHEIYFRAVTMGCVGVAAHVLFVLDAVEVKNGAIKRREASDVFRAEVHVMEMKFHG
jgi:hypothetical protein